MSSKNRHAPLIFGTIMIVGLVGYVTLFRSSPGDLSAPHAAVAKSSFIKDCNKCHENKDVSVGCQSCHTEIKNQIDQHQGFHNFLMQGRKVSCAKCHSEHNGRGFQLVNKVSWEGKDPNTFSHPHVDFHLVGKHATLACKDCHKTPTKPFALPQFPDMPRPDSYLGLSQNCKTCHEDVHAGGLTPKCEPCHDQNKFKPSQGFNHDQFFPLKGGHANVACGKCHLYDKKNVQAKFFPFEHVKGTRCLDCHSNPHRTDWKQACEACHNANDSHWSAADRRMNKSTHALTGFSLTAPHGKVSCASCHAPSKIFNEKYPNPHSHGYNRSQNSCEGCHADPHKGQFVDRHPRCIECHSAQRFMPAKFTAAHHTIYPLVGGHALASCNACHIKNPKTGVRQFTGTPRACVVCHADVHRKQFQVAGKTTCENCHQSAKAWSLLSFNHSQQSQFKLDEAHSKVACRECHPTVKMANGKSVVQYKPIRHECSDCHDFSK